jgi:hypothetical protein
MAKDSVEINLLPNKGESLAAQFFNWTFYIGRLIIIITETVALATFIYRFSLDMHIVDQHDTLTADSEILTDFKSQEDMFRDVQNRLTFAKQADAQGSLLPGLLTYLIHAGQGSVTFNSILLSASTAKIEVQASNTSTITNFINSVRKCPQVASVSIDNVEDKTDIATIVVTITAYLKPNGLETVQGQQSAVQQP